MCVVIHTYNALHILLVCIIYLHMYIYIYIHIYVYNIIVQYTIE